MDGEKDFGWGPRECDLKIGFPFRHRKAGKFRPLSSGGSEVMKNRPFRHRVRKPLNLRDRGTKVGVYIRKYRKSGRKIWWFSYTAAGRQIFETSHSTSKRFAERLLAIRQAEVAEGRFEMLKASPKLGEWSEKYLKRISHDNTRRRYTVSRQNLVRFFGEGTQLTNITAARIEDFICARRVEKVKNATLNRDLRFCAQLLKQAERERCLGRSPFDLGKFFQNENKDRRKPHILTWEQQEQLLSVAPPRIRVLTILGTETGMRTGEMLGLRWQDIDFLNDTLQVVKSKSAAGVRGGADIGAVQI
jgi:hypothetical protein